MTLRLSSVAALLCLAVLSGCIEDDDASSPADEAQPASAEATTVTRTGTVELGSTTGMALTPSRFDFTVVVPAGGATNVRWVLTVDGPLANNVNNHVEGPACEGGGNVGLSVSVMGSSSTGGACGDLAEGEHAFVAVIGSPALGFTATVSGDATVVYAVDGA